MLIFLVRVTPTVSNYLREFRVKAPDTESPGPWGWRSPSWLALVSVFMALVFPYTSATAQTLRCGSYLIQVGDDAFSVIAKCGNPTQRTTLSEPVYASSADGGTYPTGVVANTELWRYDRGSGSFPVIMKIVDGHVQSIHFVR